MPTVEVKEIVDDINLDGLGSIYSIKKSTLEPYNPNAVYYIIYDISQNNKINGLVGLPIKAENFSVPNANINRVAMIDNLSKDEYEIIKIASETKDLIIFYDEDNDMIFYRRLFFEIIDGYYDVEREAFWNDNNIVKLRAIVKDSNDNPDDDIKTMDAKILRAGGDIAPIPELKISVLSGKKISDRKFEIDSGSIVEIDCSLLDDMTATLRVKARLDNMGVSAWWLTAYLKFQKNNEV